MFRCIGETDSGISRRDYRYALDFEDFNYGCIGYTGMCRTVESDIQSI
jgi:hypothetical protein